MALSPRQLQDIERAYSDGLSSKEIIQVLGEHGEPLSEATLRKYVQLGLLPRSRRVGQKGKHRGSRGIYPVEVIRRVDEIRRAMDQGDTLEALARAAQATRAKLSTVRVALDEALDAAEVDLAGRGLDKRTRAALKAELAGLRRGGKDWLKSVDRWMAEVEQAERAVAKSAEASNGRAPASRSRRGGV